MGIRDKMIMLTRLRWMPIRQVEMDDNLRIWRSFSIGSLFDLVMLDTRQYDRSITDLYWNTDYIHSISNDAAVV
jgi:alkaline phosphatase D